MYIIYLFDLNIIINIQINVLCVLNVLSCIILCEDNNIKIIIILMVEMKKKNLRLLLNKELPV